MDKEEEILRLLQEIRDAQQQNYDEWKKARQEAILAQQRAISKSKVHMRIALAIVAALVLLWALPAFVSRGLWTIRDRSFLENQEHYEAREWILSNSNVSPLASNRFGSKEKALEFVDLLYNSGAKTVYVTNIMTEESRIEEEGGPYSDSIVVLLPDGNNARKKLFEINRLEAQKEGFHGMTDVGQKELFFWWD